MNIYLVDLNIKLVAAYYSEEKHNLFRVQVDVTLTCLKDKLDQIQCPLNHKDTMRMDNDEYRCPSNDSDESVQSTKMRLKNDEDVITIFARYLASTILKDQSIWTFSWSDLSMIFGKV